MSLIGTTSWPEIPYLSRQHVLHVCNLSLADTLCQHPEDGTGDLLGIDVVIAPELLLDAGQELFSMALSQWLAGWIPAFVVEATDQHRELRSELRHLLHRKPVAQRVED